MKTPIAQISKIGMVVLVVTVVASFLTTISEIPFIGIPAVLVVSGLTLAITYRLLKKKVSRKLRKVTHLFS